VPLDSIKDTNINCHIVTEDGSQGAKGTAVDFLNRFSKQSGPLTEAYGAACVCGPVGMLKALAEPLSAAGLKAFFSLESRMACGYGVCQGCTVVTYAASEGGKIAYRKVCTDGPVFAGEEICWEALQAE